MPKQTFVLDTFHGGLNSNDDPRDIEKNQLVSAVDVSLGSIGRIKMSGSMDYGSNGTTYLGTGTAQSGASGNIRLAADASDVDDFYNGAIVTILSGAGNGQSRVIEDYIGSSERAVVATSWSVNPDSTSVYKIENALTETGTAQAGASSSITLQNDANATDDYYNTATITIIGGDGDGESKVITGYVGSTFVATVGTSWSVNPSSNSTYIISNQVSSLSHGHGLYVVSTDNQINDPYTSGNETLYLNSDGNTAIDVRDSKGWVAGKAAGVNVSTPVYYSADGAIRIGDGSFTEDSRWFGYFDGLTLFDSLNATITLNGYEQSRAAINEPGVQKSGSFLSLPGYAIMSTPHDSDDKIDDQRNGPDNNGINSVVGQYIGGKGGELLNGPAVNLRVGIANAKSIRGDRSLGTEASKLEVLDNDDNGLAHGDVGFANDYILSNYEYYGNDGTHHGYDSTNDLYPLMFDNNICCGGNASHAMVTTQEGSEYLNLFNIVHVKSTQLQFFDFTISSETSVILGMYFYDGEGTDSNEVVGTLSNVAVFLGSDADNFRRWNFSGELFKEGWNVVVCKYGDYEGTYGNPPEFGERHNYFKIRVEQVGTSANMETDLPKFYLSGPATIDDVGATGFTEGTYSFYQTWLYDRFAKQESVPAKFIGRDESNQLKELNQITIVGGSILFNFDVYVLPWKEDDTSLYGLSKRIVGSRLYYKKLEDESHFLIGELDFVGGGSGNTEKGFKFFPESDKYDYNFENTHHSNILNIGDSTRLYKTALVSGIAPKFANVVDSWKSINGYYGKIESLEAKFKTATVHGRRSYIGNVEQQGTSYPDRMLKSKVNCFDIFPNIDSVVDVAIRDGESIVKLESYADRILQFKEKTLYIVNISENVAFLESTHKYKGIGYPYHSVMTDDGAVWINEYGVFHFNGQEINNLLIKRNRYVVSDATWASFMKDGVDGSSDDANMSSAMIGYVPKQNQVIIKNENKDSYVYDFTLDAWTECGSLKMGGAGVVTTNFAVSGDNELFVISNLKSESYTWNADPSVSSAFSIITKDFDFGDPSIRKKIYKVYVTYRTGNKYPNVSATFDVNGGTSYDKTFKDDDNYSENTTTDYKSFEAADGWQRAVLKPTTSSEANNIYSVSLKFNVNNVLTGTATGGSNSHILLAANASTSNDFYDGMTAIITGGTNAGETGVVANYLKETKRADFAASTFTYAIDTTSTYAIGVVPAEFEINDITIIYRVKAVK